MRAYDKLVKMYPEWKESKFFVADNVITQVDSAEDFAFFQSNKDFILYPPYMDYVVEGKSSETGVTVLGKIDIISVDDALEMAREYDFPPDEAGLFEEGIEWIFKIRIFNSVEGNVVIIPQCSLIPVGKDGKSIRDKYFSFSDDEDMDRIKGLASYGWSSEKIKEMLIAAVSNGVSLMLYVTSLINCNNIDKIHVPLSKRARRKNKHAATPRHEYHVLKMQPRKKSISDGNSEGSKRRQHFVRGGIATYSEDAPLFGKLVGTFYRPPHQRGDPSKGTVDKTYELPDPKEYME